MTFLFRSFFNASRDNTFHRDSSIAEYGMINETEPESFLSTEFRTLAYNSIRIILLE